VLSIRKKENITVRQPLARVRIPVLDESVRKNLEKVEDLIKAEVNVKAVEFVTEQETRIVKNLKLNFKSLGKTYGQVMKAIQEHANGNPEPVIADIERHGEHRFSLGTTEVVLTRNEVEIIPVDIPGWKVANQGAYTVALDIQLSEELRNEGLARELVNRIQNLRKENGYEITDRIKVRVKAEGALAIAINHNKNYICAEILADSLTMDPNMPENQSLELVLDEEFSTRIQIEK